MVRKLAKIQVTFAKMTSKKELRYRFPIEHVRAHVGNRRLTKCTPQGDAA